MLYMIEFVVADLRVSTEWYANLLRRQSTLTDFVGGFALFDCGSCRLALKEGEPRVGNGSVVFQVADLSDEIRRLAALGVETESAVKVSPEGYRRAFVRDPDGHRVGLFEWVSTTEEPRY